MEPKSFISGSLGAVIPHIKLHVPLSSAMWDVSE